MSRSFRCVLSILLLAAPLIAGAQTQLRVQGNFLSDSVKIGQETAFALSARYQAETSVLFPDSAHNFFPFEYVRKVYFPTETRDGVSYDSAVYYLMTFETDRAQPLSLPLYAINEQDCTVYRTAADTIRLIELVSDIPDSIATENLPLKMETAYYPVRQEINTALLLIIGGVVIVLAIVFWIIFGRRVLRYFRARKLQRRHREFVASYNAFISELSGSFSRAGAESALSAWKKYMEQLEARPYTKLTTRETATLVNDETLRHNLSAIDRAIYGHATTVTDSLQVLRSVADDRFSKKLEEVRNGK